MVGLQGKKNSSNLVINGGIMAFKHVLEGQDCESVLRIKCDALLNPFPVYFKDLGLT